MSCSWVEPAPESGFVVTAQRKPVASECTCVQCAAPGEFRLSRPLYDIKLSNGDRWYPTLTVQVVSAQSAALTLESDQLRCASPRFDCEVPIIGNNFAPNPQFTYPSSITLTVKDADGRIVGSETFGITIRSHSYTAKIIEF